MRHTSIGLAFAAAALALPATVSAQDTVDPAHGEAVFDDVCASCHLKAGGGQGPTLVGVVGRPAASVPGVMYSKALLNAHLTWTPAQLSTFLASPQAAVPGTAMPMSVEDAKDRADLIAYLASPANKP